MVRSAAKKVVWVGRATVFLVGLAVIVALVVGLASTALASNGANFIIGNGVTDTVKNIATLPTRLTMQGTNTGPALQVTQQSTNTGAQGLGVTVPAGKAPLTVNSTAGKAPNLNADKLDGKSAEQLSRVAVMNTFATTTLTGTEAPYGALSITAPAAGFVRVNGNVTVLNDPNNPCSGDCSFFARVRHINSGVYNNLAFGDVLNSAFDNVSLDGVFPVSAGVNTFEIRLARGGTTGTVYGWYGTLTAEYTPYGSTGTGTLSSSTTTTMSAAQEGAITKELPAER